MTFEVEDLHKDGAKFHWADYVVFVLSLAVSLGIGIYFAVVACLKKTNTSDEFLLGNRDLHWLPAGLSLTVSVLNAGFVIGVPAEIYYFGSVYVMAGVGAALAMFFAVMFFIPTFSTMNIVSAYEVWASSA